MERDFVVEVDRDLCVMAENCSLHAPKTFSHDDAGIVVLGDTTASTAEELVMAEFECPSGAIQLRRQ
jgi:ferredoxin